MSIGLKLKDVRRFGQKVQRGVRNIARKIEKGTDVASSILTPIAGAVAGPEGIAAVEGLAKGVKSAARGVEKATSVGVGRGTKAFKAIQQPVLGARELAQAAKGAVKNPAQAQIRIGDVIANRMPQKKRSIQRTDGTTEEVGNDWAELPFAGGM